MSSEFSFAQIPRAEIPRSAFNRSHGHKTTFDAGYIIPVWNDEVLPGDTFVVNAAFFARLSTPIVPSMDNLYLDSFFFFVPNRLLWTNWVKLMGEQTSPGDSTDYLVPQITSPAGGWAVGSLEDYFGIPTGVQFAAQKGPSALWSRAYNLIWNQWFRDENLQPAAASPMDDGPDTPGWYATRRRGKRHDYFTSCLPWPQKPGPGAAYANGVPLPLGTTAPVIADVNAGNVAWQSPFFSYMDANGLNVVDAAFQEVLNAGTAVKTQNTNSAGATRQLGFKAGYRSGTHGYSGLVADLSNAVSATINTLRQAFQIQRLLERDARGGTRYTEIVRSHFGVVSPDARLQRAEYLGGGSVPIVFNSVAQTAPKAAAGTLTPQGNLAAFGVAGGSGLGFSKSFTEHGVLLGLVCVRQDQAYQQGLHKMFSRRTRFDFYWPALSHLGEQAVLNKEIYADASANDELVFGYQERWAEYRYAGSKITGKFRSTYATPLDVWHYAQKFTALPTLGATFIQEDPPIVRNQAVTTEPHFLLDAHFAIKCVRPMPTYSVPGLMDHF